MKEWILPRAQQAEIANMLKKAGFDPLAFDLKTVASTMVKGTLISSFVHRKTSYHIDFDTTESGGYFLRYTPGDDEPISKVFPGPWKATPSYVHKWIDALKKDLEAESPWQPFAEAQAFGRFAASPDNPPFSAEEQTLVGETLDEVLQLIVSKVTLTEDGQRLMAADILYLKESSRRLGKKDFVLLFLGWAMDKGLSNGIQPDVLSQVFQLVSEKLHHILATVATLINYFSQSSLPNSV